MPRNKGVKKQSPVEDVELQEALQLSLVLQKEEAQRQKNLEEEVKRRIAEEEGLRRAKEERELEEDFRRREEEQKRAERDALEKATQERTAAERKKRLEEQVQKKLEAENHKAGERKQQTEDRRKQIEEEQIKPDDVTFIPNAPAIDLLGGLTDEEDEEPLFEREELHRVVPKRASQPWDQAPPQQRQIDGGVSSSRHRDLPQRGPVDIVADEWFDGVSHLRVAVKKSARLDGVYLFGTRVIKLKLEHGQLYVTITPKNVMTLAAFVERFDRVEALRVKGLNAAINVCISLSIPKSMPKTQQLLKA